MNQKQTKTQEEQREWIRKNPPGGMPVIGDEELAQTNKIALSAHSEQYTKLLQVYVSNFEKNVAEKQKNRKALFWIAIILLVSIPRIIVIYLIITWLCIVVGKIDVLESIPSLLTVLVTFVGTYMTIPKMITKYLFNKKEEEHLATIIQKTQDYDQKLRNSNKK